MTDLQQTCIHEAGHLLANILANNKWSLATVVGDYESYGHVKSRIPKTDDGLARLLLAGGAAEDIMDIPASEGAGMEYQQAVSLVGETRVRTLMFEVLDSFKEHKKTLKEIANHLEQSKALTPDGLEGGAKTLSLRVTTDAVADSIQQKLDLLAHS